MPVFTNLWLRIAIVVLLFILGFTVGWFSSKSRLDKPDTVQYHFQSVSDFLPELNTNGVDEFEGDLLEFYLRGKSSNK